jgi:hypothetical protein
MEQRVHQGRVLSMALGQVDLLGKMVLDLLALELLGLYL